MLSKDPTTWNDQIAVDEIRQENSDPQSPHSDAYLSGAPAKRRKVIIQLFYIFVSTSNNNMISFR